MRVGVFAHDVQQRRLAGRLIIGDAGLDHMPGAVELVAFFQVLPFVFRLLDDEVGVQVAVRLLRAADQRDQLVRLPFQLCVRPQHQRIGRRFQPLGHVAVLEDHAVKFAPALPGRNAEVFDGVAFFRAGDRILQNRFLVGDDHVHHEVLERRPKGVFDRHVFDAFCLLPF